MNASPGAMGRPTWNWVAGWPIALPLLILGGFLIGLGGMLATWGGWWWLGAAPAFGLGILLVTLGTVGMVTPWVWLKVDVRSPGSPRIRFGLPIPVRLAGWGARFAGARTEGFEPLIQSLGEIDQPIEIEVDDPDAGEHVAVSLRRVGERSMTTSEERMKILKMVEEGKLKPEEAAQLLGALGKDDRRREVETDIDSRWLRVRVTDLGTGKTKVNINVPMRLVGVGMRVGARFVPDVEGVDMQDLFQSLQEGMTGKIVDVVDEEDNERVEIFAE
ncbi:MAG TPA: hypothetical protein VLL77_05655 [Anaerolineales bacterium]|nr:hypothetical protein [Anaerolineales bacterium]